MRDLHDAVVTGMGVVSPIGCSVDSFWDALLQGRSGVAPITRFDPSDLSTRFAGQVEPDAYYPDVPRRVSRRVDRFVVMALAAGSQALRQARLTEGRPAGLRIGTCLGTSSGPLETNYAADVAFERSGADGLRRALPYVSTAASVCGAVSELSLQHGLSGPSLTVSGECASGTNAIGTALAMIRTGAADAMVCGGVDATVNARSMAIMSTIGALSARNDEPRAACRPFDRDRDGFVMAEGAAVLVLESAASAQARGAQVLGHVLGYGAATDTHHATAPDPEARGASAAIRQALTDADVVPEAVGLVNAHATGTRLNDEAELTALRDVFGPSLSTTPVYGIKPQTGHMLGAAGAAEAIAVLLSLQTGLVPPTLNCDQPIDTGVDIVRRQVRTVRARYGMSTSFGFGGQCAVLVLGGDTASTASGPPAVSGADAGVEAGRGVLLGA